MFFFAYNRSMNKLKSWLLIILSVCIGTIFLYSAYTKIYSLESFERFQYTIVEYVHLPWILAILGARILTGMEAALGLLIMLHLFGRNKLVLKIALWLLTAFSIYLVYLWIAVGNDVNCGCFGDAIWMSPSSSLIKNVILAACIILLLQFHKGLQMKWQKWAAPILFLGITIIPFIVYPLPDNQPQWVKKGKYKLDLSALYAPGKIDAPKVDLYNGKYVLAFFSLKCPHCKMAAYKMHVMKLKNPTLPFHIVIAGRDEYLKPFWDNTKAEDIPHTKLAADDFTAIAGYSWPAIFLVNNGWVEAETNYISMDQGQIESWLKK